MKFRPIIHLSGFPRLILVTLAITTTTLLGQDFVWTQANAPQLQWQFVVSSADGAKLMAIANVPSAIYASIDSGFIWTKTAAPVVPQWCCGASSSDGVKLVAADNIFGGIYTSNNSGLTWSKTSAPVQNWWSIASSSDGTKLVAGSGGSLINGSGIYTSANSGLTWTKTSASSNSWNCVGSSYNGTKLVAVVFDGGIYSSTNSGFI